MVDEFTQNERIFILVCIWFILQYFSRWVLIKGIDFENGLNTEKIFHSS